MLHRAGKKMFLLHFNKVRRLGSILGAHTEYDLVGALCGGTFPPTLQPKFSAIAAQWKSSKYVYFCPVVLVGALR